MATHTPRPYNCVLVVLGGGHCVHTLAPPPPTHTHTPHAGTQFHGPHTLAVSSRAVWVVRAVWTVEQVQDSPDGRPTMR